MKGQEVNNNVNFPLWTFNSNTVRCIKKKNPKKISGQALELTEIHEPINVLSLRRQNIQNNTQGHKDKS